MSRHTKKPFQNGLHLAKIELENILNNTESMYSREPYQKKFSTTDKFIESLTELKLQIDLIVEHSGSNNEIKKEVSKIINRSIETNKRLKKFHEDNTISQPHLMLNDIGGRRRFKPVCSHY